MKSSYRKIGSFIRLVDNRNKNLKITNLLGLTTQKKFIPSVGNIIGADMTNYKIISKNQFACSLMQVRRDKKMPVALYNENESAIISQAYPIFEIINTKELNPEYFMMWMTRSEFDREACFYAVGGVRGSLEWDDFCEMELPVPDIKIQKEIVKEYTMIINRIEINNHLIQKCEEAAQAIYKNWFVDFEFPDENGKPYTSNGGELEYNEELDFEIPKGWDTKQIQKIIPVKDGTHDSPQPTEKGFPLVTSKHIEPYKVNLDKTYNISSEDYEQVNKRSKVDTFDILFSMIGTVGNLCYVLDEEINFAIKNVGLFKTSTKRDIKEYILFYLKSDIVNRYHEQNLIGGVQDYVTLTYLREIPCILPKEKILNNFQSIIKPIVDEIYLKVKENNLNSTLKEILLSKMSKIIPIEVIQ